MADEKKPVEHKTIAAALCKAQTEMGKALKSANNPHFKSKYADLSSVVDACMPALNANGIAVIQPPFDDETGRYVKTILLHASSGETLECRVPLVVQKNDMQGYGSASTYARRYGLMAMAGIAPEDDDGNAAAKAAPVAEKETPTKQATPVEVETAVENINAAETLAGLGTLWTMLNKNAPHVVHDATVIDAKNARKAALSAALVDDAIPY